MEYSTKYVDDRDLTEYLPTLQVEHRASVFFFFPCSFFFPRPVISHAVPLISKYVANNILNILWQLIRLGPLALKIILIRIEIKQDLTHGKAHPTHFTISAVPTPAADLFQSYLDENFHPSRYHSIYPPTYFHADWSGGKVSNGRYANHHDGTYFSRK